MLTPEQRAELVHEEMMRGHGNPLGDGGPEAVAEQIRQAVAAEREQWSKAAERLELGEFRKQWLEEANRLWGNRFSDPRPAGELIWITRCRELLIEMFVLQQTAAWLRKDKE